MRVTVGAVAVLGLAVAVATAQPGAERAAVMKAPQALAPNELPVVARGAADDFPPSTSGTPVARPAGVTPGPAWLTGDTGVTTAAGVSTRASAVRPLDIPPTPGRDEKMPPPPKMLDRLKIFPGDKAAAPTPSAPQPVAQTAPQPAPAPQPTASTPFRGTGTNGAPVFAGPPAYRWYGWGSVTPGANPLAPAGQYPKASANWYQITGATPGAFPVPVTNGARPAPGTEPPTYGLAARTPAPAPVAPPTPTFVDRPEPPRFVAPETKFPPPTVGALPPAFAPPAVPVPALTPPPLPRPATAIAPSLPPPAMPLTVAPSLPPAPNAGPVVAAPAVPPKAEPVAALPTPPLPAVAPAPVVPSVAPAAPVAVAPSVEPARHVPLPVEPKALVPTPAALPTSVTADPPRDEQKWKQSAEPAAPRPGTWAPASAPAGPAPLPTAPVEPPAGWQTGRAGGAPVVARGQFGDNTPDPVTTLVKQMCQGRAADVEVRHTGTKKIQVCFETRTADDARKLVSDISRRPELTAYQIDFCVVVK